MRRMVLLSTGAFLFALMFCPPVSATIIVYASHNDHPLIDGASLSDVSMAIDMLVSGGLATMSFTNTSSGAETSAVFKEIVIDTYDGDLPAAGAVLWDPVLLTSTSDVSFRLARSNGLPGYHAETAETPALIELQAASPPPKKGLGPGETLVVQFGTSLADGSDIDDYCAFFGSGADTASYSIGFHAIDVAVVNGQSVSGIYMPEPGAMTLIVAGAIAWSFHKRRVPSRCSSGSGWPCLLRE